MEIWRTCLTAYLEFDTKGKIYFTGTMILITTGRGSPDDNGMNTEIIDPEKSNFECNKVQPFLVFLYGAGGGLINGKIPFICGGFSHGDPWTKENACYQLTESGS